MTLIVDATNMDSSNKFAPFILSCRVIPNLFDVPNRKGAQGAQGAQSCGQWYLSLSTLVTFSWRKLCKSFRAFRTGSQWFYRDILHILSQAHSFLSAVKHAIYMSNHSESQWNWIQMIQMIQTDQKLTLLVSGWKTSKLGFLEPPTHRIKMPEADKCTEMYCKRISRYK